MKYKCGYKYQVEEPEKYDLSYFNLPDGGNYWVKIQDGWLKIAFGYAWDGLTGVPDTRKSMRAGLIHDALYQLLREELVEGLRREYADEVFRRVLIEDGFSCFMTNVYSLGVRKFAAKAADKSSIKKINIAP